MLEVRHEEELARILMEREDISYEEALWTVREYLARELLEDEQGDTFEKGG